MNAPLGLIRSGRAIIFLLLCTAPWLKVIAAQTLQVHLSYLGSHTSPAFFGVSQGLAEANLMGRFLAQHYILHEHPATEAIQAQAPNISAILAAVDSETLKRLSVRYPHVPILNLTLEDDALRALCLPNVLHVIPSLAMRQEAIAQWRRLHPEAKVSALAWHPEFEKYAAKQLNRRYRKAYGRPMDDQAWAGWAAVKMISDSIARSQSAEPAKLLDYLKNQLSFDGQKGVTMKFRATGQLSQILLLVEEGRIVGEAPVKGVVDPLDLDRLGATDCP
jgi:hypothetical protein